MDKKVVLLTGASGGLGSAIAALLCEDFQFVLHHHSSELPDELADKGFCVSADLTVESEIEQMIQQVMKKFGRIDVLINNAGVSESAMSWKTDSDSWRKTMAVNLDAPFYVSKAVIPHMRKNGFGRIVNISSVVAVTGVLGTAAYAASKAGLIGLTKTLAKELASFGITVNAFALGYFDRGMIDDVPEEQRKELMKSVPVNRLGTPEDITSTLRWLISDKSAFVTGQTIHLNGGLFG